MSKDSYGPRINRNRKYAQVVSGNKKVVHIIEQKSRDPLCHPVLCQSATIIWRSFDELRAHEVLCGNCRRLRS